MWAGIQISVKKVYFLCHTIQPFPKGPISDTIIVQINYKYAYKKDFQSIFVSTYIIFSGGCIYCIIDWLTETFFRVRVLLKNVLKTITFLSSSQSEWLDWYWELTNWDYAATFYFQNLYGCQMPKSAQGAYFLLVAIREKLALCVIYAMFCKMENGLKQTRKTTQGSIFQLSCITYQ